MNDTSSNVVEIPAWLAAMLVWAFRGLCVVVATVAFSTWLDVRDLVRLHNDPKGTMMGSMSQADWEYEKKLLLIDHEQIKTELEIQEMKIQELEDEQK